MSFLSELTTSLIEDNKFDYKDLVIVLPNKRAMKTLYREWACRIKTPILAPTIFTIDELIKSLSTITLASNSELLVELYKVAQKYPELQTDDFQKFVSWGNNFLKDINEIDMYLVNADQIFDLQYAFKETNFIMADKLSLAQQRYLALFKTLNPIYQEFTQHLRSIKKGYLGLIYRDVADNIQDYIHNAPWKRIVFAGLHALSPSELRIAQFFKDNIPCEFLFDLDQFYYDTKHSFKIREAIDRLANQLNISKIQNIHDDYAQIPKKINILGVSKKMTQIYQAIQLLEQYSLDELKETAVVFADESLLMPFVHVYSSINCNITMGYPIKYTRTYQLLQALLNTAQNIRRLSNSSNGALYHKDVIAILRNPLIAKTYFDNSFEHSKFVGDIIKSNRIFFGNSIFDKMTDSFPDLSKDGTDFLSELIRFFQNIEEKIMSDTEERIITLIKDSLTELANDITAFPKEILIDIQTIKYFIEDKIQQISIPFQRNEGADLQVMGLLETRALDFKHVIILSVNEGVIPVSKNENSLLLFEVKRNFGLPTMQQNEAIYAYHFFRLLQRAESVDLIYNSDSSDSSGVAEESRFIRQLEWRIQQLSLPYEISRQNALYISPKTATNLDSVSIKNNDRIRERIATSYFSATSLTNYITCPLRFYFENVAKITPPESIEESVEQRVIGNVMHKILEDTFNEFKGIQNGQSTEISETQVDEILQKNLCNENIEKVFKEQEDMGDRDLKRGKIYLAQKVVGNMLSAYKNVIKNDILYHNVTIIASELKMKADIGVDGGEKIHLIGFADRVELRNDNLTILDYKTGEVKPKELEFNDIKELFELPEKKKLLQLMMYTYLYCHNENCDNPDMYPRTEKIDCGIISFQNFMKNNEKEEASLCIPVDKSQDKKQDFDFVSHMTDFEEELRKFLKGIITSKTFSQTEDNSRCCYCDYAEICGRNNDEKKW